MPRNKGNNKEPKSSIVFKQSKPKRKTTNDANKRNLTVFVCVSCACVCVCVCVDCAVFSNLFVSLVGVVALWFSCVCLVGCFCSPLGFLLLSLLPIRPTHPP